MEDTNMPTGTEEQITALEHKCYMMFLQLNALTELLVKNNILSKEDIGKTMDSIHDEILRSISELDEKL